MSETVLEATHSGVVKLGNVELACYVLNNGERVLAQRNVVNLLTGGRESGDLRRYLRAEKIEPLLPIKLRTSHYDTTILKFLSGKNLVHGLKASDVIDICNAYLTARANGDLQPNQAKLAEQAEILIRASGKTGIDAIIDEATGYEHFKRAHDLQERFAAYLRDGYREWTLAFDKEFFMQLYKLEGQKPPIPQRKYPKRFGRYIMRYIYDTLDPDIADWLRENNPNPEGQEHHHQKFNPFGYKRLTDHLMSVIGIMKASPTMERFKENLALAFPNARTQRMARLQQAKAERGVNPNQGVLFKIL